MEVCRHQVGPVELVAGVAEVLADGPEMDAAACAVFREPGGLGCRPTVGAGSGLILRQRPWRFRSVPSRRGRFPGRRDCRFGPC